MIEVIERIFYTAGNNPLSRERLKYMNKGYTKKAVKHVVIPPRSLEVLLFKSLAN